MKVIPGWPSGPGPEPMNTGPSTTIHRPVCMGCGLAGCARHRSVEQGSNLQAARPGSLTKPATPVGVRENSALAPLLGARSDGRALGGSRRTSLSRSQPNRSDFGDSVLRILDSASQSAVSTSLFSSIHRAKRSRSRGSSAPLTMRTAGRTGTVVISEGRTFALRPDFDLDIVPAALLIARLRFNLSGD